ncbi:MAG: HD domain-containing protein, partial [Clostridia bacterium]|nr:HD domain-containing protein [Clostridia bacterium]
FGHTVHAVEYAPKRIRLAALMHDIGKGACEINYGNMYNHASCGSEITRKVMERLKFSNAEINYTCALVAHHMIDMHGNTHENKLRKFIASHAEIIDDLTDLIIADARATGKDIDLDKCTRIKRIRDKMLQDSVPFNLSQLAVNGEDLKQLGYNGKAIGNTLNELLDMCIFGIKRNDKQELLDMLIRRKNR